MNIWFQHEYRWLTFTLVNGPWIVLTALSLWFIAKALLSTEPIKNI